MQILHSIYPSTKLFKDSRSDYRSTITIAADRHTKEFLQEELKQLVLRLGERVKKAPVENVFQSNVDLFDL